MRDASVSGCSTTCVRRCQMGVRWVSDPRGAQETGNEICRLAPPSGDVAGDDAAVVKDDDLLDQREAEAGAVCAST